MAGNLELILGDGSYINCRSIQIVNFISKLNNNFWYLKIMHLKKGVLIPNLMNLVQELKSNALFVLVVEKDGEYQTELF